MCSSGEGRLVGGGEEGGAGEWGGEEDGRGEEGALGLVMLTGVAGVAAGLYMMAQTDMVAEEPCW